MSTTVHPQMITHPDLILIEKGKGDFSTRAVSVQTLPAGALIAPMTGTPATTRTYATVQTSKSGDIDLDSDLVYCNHSCAPTAVFDTTTREVRVLPSRDLQAGEDITFFYPSTEWDMDQPFECTCGADVCVGTVRGAKYLPADVLARYWLNTHIRDLLQEGQEAEKGQGL